MFSGYLVFLCARQEATCNLQEGGPSTLGWRAGQGSPCGTSWKVSITEFCRQAHASGHPVPESGLVIASEGCLVHLITSYKYGYIIPEKSTVRHICGSFISCDVLLT